MSAARVFRAPGVDAMEVAVRFEERQTPTSLPPGFFECYRRENNHLKGEQGFNIELFLGKSQISVRVRKKVKEHTIKRLRI